MSIDIVGHHERALVPAQPPKPPLGRGDQTGDHVRTAKDLYLLAALHGP